MDVDHQQALGFGNGRTLDIDLGSHEIVTIDLDNLDPHPEDAIELLRDGQCRVAIWNRLAQEYCKQGYFKAALEIAKGAISYLNENDIETPSAYMLLANIQLALARKAPKIILRPAQRDDMTSEESKSTLQDLAANYLNQGEKVTQETGGDLKTQRGFLTRGVHQWATRSFDDALQSFETVLSERPTNLIALMGKARILYTRRLYGASLKLFQKVLTLSPNMSPDPRIGIGLCLWAMDFKTKAKAAWQRSLDVHPTDWAAQLLLGIEAINSSKNVSSSEEERTTAYAEGTKYIGAAFNANQRNAAAANALCDFFLRKGDHQRALKLAERTIQFADTITILTDGYIHAGQIAQADGDVAEATKQYTAALKGLPKNVQAAVGLAQVQLQNDEILPAIHTLDTLIQPPNPQRPVEALAMLASLRAYPRPGLSTSDAAQEKTRAKDLFDQALKHLEGVDGLDYHSKSNTTISEDKDMYIEIARLWQEDGLDKMRRAYEDAIRISDNSGEPDPRLLNNLGVLRHLEGDAANSPSYYEKALGFATGENAESISVTILYNLARTYESLGAEEKAKEIYDKLLTKHPEYVDAKVRQAQLLSVLNRSNEAHELVKQALASQSGNLNIRAFYTHFLIQNNMIKLAKEFVFNTLRDFDKHDIYSLCAAGWIHYHQARESRETNSKGQEDRKQNFRRAAEFYEKALQFDPLCAFAAQGLAIVTAEDVLLEPDQAGLDMAAQRVKSARDSLDVLGKIRESLNDGSVYLNMGHCYYARDEFDRAIESYETALKRYQDGRDVNTILCLCRSWYAKAIKDQSFTAMITALKYSQMAFHIQPSDKCSVYNTAMIEQKATEMLFGMDPSKRTLKDLQCVIDQGAHAQKLFASLAADKTSIVPYNKDMADQRRKYGEGMLRKADEHLAIQRHYEEENEAKLKEARLLRQQERELQLSIERTKVEEIRKQAEFLAEERRRAREEAQAWSLAARGDSDDEREKRPRKAGIKKASKTENGSADEAGEPRRKRKNNRIRKEGEPDAEEAIFSGDEEEGRPAKKRIPKKRVVRDDDDEVTTAAPRRKQFKSKETISDSDEEMS